MALHWDTSKCKPDGELSESDFSMRDMLIWGALETGLNRISDKNIEEWFFRLKVARDLDISVMPQQVSDGRLYDALHKWNGLHTNASPKTRAAWRKEIFERAEGRVKKAWSDAERTNP